MKPFKNFDEIVEFASIYNGEIDEIDVDNIEVIIEDESWACYAVAVSHRDITAYCHEGQVCYDVNNISGNWTACIADYDRD